MGLAAVRKEPEVQLAEAISTIEAEQPVAKRLEATRRNVSGLQRRLDEALGTVAAFEQQLADARSAAATIQTSLNNNVNIVTQLDEMLVKD